DAVAGTSARLHAGWLGAAGQLQAQLTRAALAVVARDARRERVDAAAELVAAQPRRSVADREARLAAGRAAEQLDGVVAAAALALGQADADVERVAVEQVATMSGRVHPAAHEAGRERIAREAARIVPPGDVLEHEAMGVAARLGAF